jgi:glycosyltransferase involved in cell wall biosynthesis
MPTILFVAPLYRPESAPGAQRIGSFVDELENRGWCCKVLTTPADSRLPNVLRLPHKPGALTQRLGRFRLARLGTIFHVPDQYAPWGFRTFRAGSQLSEVAAVVSSSLPGTAAVAGAAIAHRLSVPHVADFRDPWGFNPYYAWPSRTHHRLDQLLERLVLERASALVCVSEPMRDAYLDRHPELQDRVHVVPNGAEAALVARTDVPAHAGDGFLISSSPGPYRPRHRRWPYYFLGGEHDHTAGLEILLNAVGQLRDAHRISLEVIGAADFDGASANVTVLPILERQRFITQTRRADLLFLPVVENPHIHRRGIAVPTRLYEYLATGRELIMSAGEGAATDLAQGLPGVFVVPPNDAEALAQRVDERFSVWRDHGRQFHPRDVPTREAAAATFADLVETVIDPTRVSSRAL